MALSVNYLYEFSLKLIKKNQSGSISGVDFAYFWNDAQSTYLGDLLGRFNSRNNGKEGNNTGLILNQTQLNKLAPFTTPVTLTIASGVSDKPLDFIYRMALRINGYDVYFINHGQIASVNNSAIDPPNATDNKYYAVEYEDYYSFLPTTVTTANLDYIAYPNSIVWGYTYSSEGQQKYNPGTSVQSKWDDVSSLEITKRMLSTMGLSLKDKDFENFGNKTIITGS